MIHNSKLTNINDRKFALDYIANLKREVSATSVFSLIDVGANANPWTRNYLTHTVDFNKSELPVTQFLGNISDVRVWNEILEYVEIHGKFSFLVSTHTIEDISAASMVCNMFSRIANEGFIAIPSKYIELSRHEGPWRGFIHHRWIYDVSGDDFIGYPKQPFLEYMPYVDEWVNKNPREGKEELQFFWKGDFKLNVVNNDYLGPSTVDVIDYYKKLTS